MRMFLLAIASLFAAVSLFAQEAPPAPTFKVGGVLFADYTWQQEPRTLDADGGAVHANAFTVTRAYINVTGTVNQYISWRITPDIGRESGTGSSLNGSQTYRLKFAYAQFNLDRWWGKNAWARFGLQQTPWVDFEESLYRYRFQGPVFVDREGFLSASDNGLGAHYAFPGDYGDIQAGVYNGETFSRAEANDQKSFQLRATWRPMPKQGLRLSGYLNNDAYEQSAARRRLIGQVSYEHPRFNAAFDYISATDRQRRNIPTLDRDGWSAWITPRITDKWGALLRHDELDLGNGTTRKRDIEGIAYWIPVPKGTTAAVMIDRDATKNPARDTRYGIKMLLTF